MESKRMHNCSDGMRDGSGGAKADCEHIATVEMGGGVIACCRNCTCRELLCVMVDLADSSE